MDERMLTFRYTFRWLRRKFGNVVVGFIEGIIKTCGDDKQIAKTVEEEGLYMADTPADCNDPAAKAKAKDDPKAATAANWWFKPYNRVAYRNMEKLVNCVQVPKGVDSVAPLLPASEDEQKTFDTVPVPGGIPLQKMLARMNCDGFLVLKDGKVLKECYANGQKDTDKHMMFSVTKFITGLLAEILIHEGKLDDSKLVIDYVPDFSASSALREATVRNVLNMEVMMHWDEGVPRDARKMANCALTRFLYTANWLSYPDGQGLPHSASMFDFCKTLERKGAWTFNPCHGNKFQYSTALSEVLGYIIAKVEGKSVAEMFAERVWSKIGAGDDCFFAADKTGAAIAGGGWVATLRDVGRLGAMVTASGRWNNQQIVPSSVIEKLRAGGDPTHMPAFVLWGDALNNKARSTMHQLPRSYISQCFSDSQRSLQAWGLFGQHLGMYHRTGVVIVAQCSNPTADGGIAWYVTQRYAEMLDEAFATKR